MPRSGVNGTYTLPPNTDNQQPLTPISSSMFNAAMDDVEQTFNTPTPVVYGGTGAADAVTARANLGAALDDPWANQPVGVPIPVWLELSSTLAPPKNNQKYRYIILSAGETGPGGYNEGMIDNEVVSGSAPLISASARVTQSVSVLHLKTVRLINTDRRFLRAGSSGTLQNDSYQGHQHARNSASLTELVYLESGGTYSDTTGGGTRGITTPTATGPSSTDGINGSPRTSNETRARNIGAIYYMRLW